MKNRIVKTMLTNQTHHSHMDGHIHLDLQLFADDGGDSEGDNGGDDDGDDDESEDDKQNEKKFTQADIDRIVKQRLAKAQREADKRAKDIAEAEKLKSMSEKERHDAEFAQMKKELAELKGEKQKADMTATASDILKEAGINVSSKLVTHLIADTAEETKENVDEFVKLYTDAVNRGIKAAMKENGKSPKKTSDNGGWTREKILAVKNPTERQNLIKEHINLFKG